MIIVAITRVFVVGGDTNMEQHPVPQNVTTFQFRLIGDMTLKQFGYLCAGAILAFIAYKLPMPFIITWPLTIVFAFLGIGFAFIPVEERPMDVWVFSFFKSIYNPTQYLWNREPVAVTASKSAKPLSQETAVRPQAAPPAQPPAAVPQPATHPEASPQQKVHVPQAAAPPQQPAATPPASATKAALTGLFQQTPGTNAPAPSVSVHRKQSLWDSFLSWLSPAPKPAAQPAPSVMHPAEHVPSVTGVHPAAEGPKSTPTPVSPTEDPVMKQKMMLLEENLAKLQEQLATKTTAEERVLELQKQLTDLLVQKSKTEEELAGFKRQQTAASPKAPAAPTQAAAQSTTPKQGAVHVITTQEGAVKAGLPRLTNVPNVITGIVKDDAGNLLPGILVTVTNAEGVPMRALKTNKLGQFGASTPLAPGTYFVEIEDPRGRFTFSRVQITLNGGVVPVLEILAKSEKALTREKLAQEIFGSTTT